MAAMQPGALHTSYSEDKTIHSLIPVIAKNLRSYSELEMLAGITASSMPIVSKFFFRQNYSLVSWGSSFRSNIKHFMTKSAREKIPGDPPSKQSSGRNAYNKGENKGYRLRDLDSDGSERKTLETMRTEDSQIHLAHDISVGQD